jgi:hypothetical protein
MKKIFAAILLVSYAFASSGASVDLHYCMGKLTGWDFDYTSKNGCQNCGMKMNSGKGCCANKQIQPKVDKEQRAACNNVSLSNHFSGLIPEYSSLNDLLLRSSTIVIPSSHAPPLIRPVPFYLLDCNFRI